MITGKVLWPVPAMKKCDHNYYPGRKKVQVGKDQEKAQSEKRFPLQKPRWEKTQTNNQVLIP